MNRDVMVFGRKMHACLLGGGEIPILLLSGSSIPLPQVEYRPLTKALAQNHLVVVLEKFGYGGSDSTDESRAIHQVVEEYRAAVTALDFSGAGEIPRDLWIHPATRQRYGAALEELLKRYPLDMTRVFGPMDRHFYKKTFTSGLNDDFWGSKWQVLRPGMVGEVKYPALPDIDNVGELKVPYDALVSEMKEKMPAVKQRIADLHADGVVCTGGYIELYQSMQFIHGTENLLHLADAPGCMGFVLPAFPKRALFPQVVRTGVLPRKTFSMGTALEKRYYLEARPITPEAVRAFPFARGLL